MIVEDRIVVAIRWVVMMVILAYLGFTKTLDTGGLAIVLAGVLWNLVLAVMSIAGWRVPFQNQLTVAGDAALALLLLFGLSVNGEPFLWGFILPALTSAFYFGVNGGLFLAIAGIVIGLVDFSLQLGFSNSAEILIVPAVSLLGLGAGFGFAAQLVKPRLRRVRRRNTTKPLKTGQFDSERIKAIYTITSELSSTLNYQRILDVALDLSGTALASESEAGKVVSAFFLFEGDEMFVGSARRFTNNDLKAVLHGREGIIAQALETGLPKITKNPLQDEEIQRVVSLRTCEVVYCYPLRTNLERFGVLIFGHPDGAYFDDLRLEILEIIGRQVMVAINNANLYHEMEEEKERMMDIQEEARNKLARDLHDGPTQSVAAIAMRINFARRLIERDVKAAGAEMFKIEDMARKTTKEIRHMLFTLRPLVLESEGLNGALKSMGEKMRDTYGQNVIVEVDPAVVEALDMSKQGVIFYIAEEAVNNARKHAEAEAIWVRVKFVDDNIAMLEIQDNGVGFNVGAVDAGYEHRGSLGMVNMRERSELVNGILKLESQEGGGTRIRVWIPLNEVGLNKLRHGR